MHPASSSSFFSFALRSSCCLQCGQPLAGADGSHVQCTRCGQPLELRPRASFVRPSSTPPPGAQPPELRAQDGRALLPPPNIAFLWDSGPDLAPHREAEALLTWQGARRRAAAIDVGAGEEVCFLTRALAIKAEQRGDPACVRALIEAGLETVQLPRQRAVLLGMMARAAARAGDVEAAMAWLSCFEPPQDLESDSEHRMTTAVVATARGDFPAVLAAVGPAFDHVAIEDSLDAQAAVFRINALERMGRLPEAQQQLQALFAKGPGFRNGLERIQQLYRAIPLCQASMPAARATHEQQARASAGKGKILLGTLLIVVSLVPVVIATLTGISVYAATGRFEAFFSVPFTLVFVPAFGLWGWRTRRMGLREKQVFEKGVRAPARVLGAAPTGVRVNNVPEMRIELEVQLQPPVRTQIRMLLHAGQQHVLTPGTMLHVRVDPAQPDVAVLEQ
jgi:hypothetical protein